MWSLLPDKVVGQEPLIDMRVFYRTKGGGCGKSVANIEKYVSITLNTIGIGYDLAVADRPTYKLR